MQYLRPDGRRNKRLLLPIGLLACSYWTWWLRLSVAICSCCYLAANSSYKFFIDDFEQNLQNPQDWWRFG